MPTRNLSLSRLVKTWSHDGRLALWLPRGLALAVVLMLASMVPLRAPIDKVWGDEGTFLAMMQSLVLDGDLRFDEGDAARASTAEGGRGHLILQRAQSSEDTASEDTASEGAESEGTSEGAYAYSKPVLFPLLASPFYAVAGELGPIGLNLLLLGLALWLARGHLRTLAARHGHASGLADLALVSFAAPSVVIPYAFWRMSDSLQFSLALLGLVLVVGSQMGADEENAAPDGRAQRILAWRGAPWLGAVCLASLVSLRVSNGLLALVPVAVQWVRRGEDRRGKDRPGRRSWRRAALMLVVVVASVLAFQFLTSVLTGADNPYRAVRATFTPATGYPVGPDADEVLTRFQKNRASHFTRIDRPAASTEVLYSSFYVWVGRHTGLFVYFPASLLLLWLAIRRSDPVGKVLLAVFLGTLAFYVGWKPGNYFGGETFLGNRYLLPAYPALLLALRQLPSARSWLPVWIFAVLALGSAVVSSQRCLEVQGSAPPTGRADLCRSSQSHAYAGVFRWLPWETTSRRIEGVRDRYWAGEFVRFVDPWADADENAFELRAGRPAAELSIAHWRKAEHQVFRVLTHVEDATLVVEHGGDEQRFAVGRQAAPGRDGWLHLEVASETPWVRHRFWFQETQYWVAAYRLRLETADEASGATARILFLGDPVSTSRAISYELLSHSWPQELAGEPLRLTLRNTSPLPWKADGPTRVTLRWRLFRPAEGGHPRHLLVDGEPLRMPRDVESGGEVELEVPVVWPDEPGRYDLETDLVLEHVAWFSQRLGSPVLRRSFSVPNQSVLEESAATAIESAAALGPAAD